MIAWLASLALVSATATVTYAWDPPDVGVADHYKVLVYQPGLPNETYTTTQSAITLPATPGQEIRVRVAACTGGVCGAWSRISSSLSVNLSADVSGDGVVGQPDFVALATQYGAPSADDLTGDGLIGQADIQVVIERFGSCIGPVSVNGQVAQAYLPCELVGP